MTHALPSQALVFVVCEGIIHVHPNCGEIRDSNWWDDEEWLLRKLERQLKDEGNRYKRIEFQGWDECVDEISRKERRYIIDETAELKATHILFYRCYAKYEHWDGYDRCWECSSKEWFFRLVDVDTKKSQRFKGRDLLGYLIRGDCIPVQCP